jgi:hypothetical protein
VLILVHLLHLTLQVEILTLFNSRTCQLLLGAGATHLGLKGQRVCELTARAARASGSLLFVQITSVHLALASQCIALVYAQVTPCEPSFVLFSC